MTTMAAWMDRSGRCAEIAGVVLLLAGTARAVDPNGFAPSPGSRWHEDFCAKGTETVLVGDFNRDHRDDLVAFDGDRVLVVFGVAERPRFDGPVDWSQHPLPAGATPVAGDLDGDGYCDLAYFAPDGIRGIFTDARGFSTDVRLADAPGAANSEYALGDVDGDGKADLIAFSPADGMVRVALSRGRALAQAFAIWNHGFLGPGQLPRVGNFDGRGGADIAVFVRGADNLMANQVQVALSAGGSFGPKEKWNDFFCVGDERPFAGDVDGDGRADIITFVRGRPGPEKRDDDPAGDVYVALSEPRNDGQAGFRFGPGIRRHAYFCVNNETPLVGDFNGDGKADLCTLVRNTVGGANRGDVYVACSTFGKPSSWNVRLDSVRISRADESSGDDPRFTIFGFRATPGDPSSIRTWSSAASGVACEGDAGVGTIVEVPEAMGSLAIPNVRALTAAEIAAGQVPEAVGFVVLATEDDNTSDRDRAEAATKACARMKQFMTEQTRDLRVAPETRWRDIREFTQAAARGANMGVMSAYRSPPSGINDTDDMVESKLFYYPAVDPEVLPLLELMPVIDFGSRTLTEQTWKVPDRPLVFSGSGSIFQAQFRVSRTDDAAGRRGSLADDNVGRPMP